MIDRLLQNNTAVKIISIVLAFILWLYIAGDTTGAPGFETTRPFIRVPVKIYNIADYLEIVDMVDEVDVTVRGPSEKLVGLTPDDLEMYLDLAGLGAGDHQLRVKGSAPQGVQIDSIYPSQVQVVIDEIITRQMEISPRLEGEPAEGYVISEVIIDPDNVILEGGSRKLVYVEEVWAVVDISQVEEDFSKTVELLPVDGKGERLEGLEISPENVEVFIGVHYPEKEVPVEVNFEGELPQGLEIEGIEIDPERVFLHGKEELLEEIQGIKTLPLDLSEREGTFSREIELEVPQGVSVEGDPRVTVMVMIRSVEE